ncbi:hypothetical protein FBALC1_12467 [Flavobacteriales bacterium ALC-1]|nr:hypothetical protein FBALC1_12467 [Flavobacteriales bacterium ALC-1]
MAQDLPNVVPPSPEAASLGKFTEVPVSHYTGLPNISIPIASYSVGGKSFPVGISYHARGVRVEEIASRVGIGWALNAGGQISRQTRHEPDDKSPYGYLNQGNAGSGNNLIKALADGTWFSSQTARNSYLNLSQSTKEKVDRMPDVFSIQAPSISGKFIFNYDDNKPILQSYNDIVIEKNSGSLIESFTVTDSQGFIYYFGVSKNGQRSAQNWEQNIGNYAFPQSGSYTLTSNPSFFKTYNAWMLMDVESPNGELVSFEYEQEITTLHRRSYDKVESNMPTNYTSKYESHQYLLKKIIHDGGEIVFQEVTTSDRDDLNGSYALDKVKIYDNNLDLVKSFKLNHSYQNAVNDSNQLHWLKTWEPESSKHLFLDSVEELGKDNTAKPAHTFTYNSQALPNRFSNSQDYWGYYNGASNGSFLKFFDDSYGPVNRTVDTLKTMAGMLEQITYPTGGSTKFIYEHNTGILNSTYDNVVKPLINPITPMNSGLSHLGSSYYQNGKYSKPVTIGQGIQGKLKVTVSLPSPQSGYCGNPINSNCDYVIKLQSSSTVYTLYSGTQEFYITPGNYDLIFDPEDPNWDPNISFPSSRWFIITMNWEDQPVEEDVHLYTSGKRIKRVEFYDSDNTLESYKEYDYNNIGGSNVTSGVVHGLPAFYSLNKGLSGGITVFEPHGAVPGSPLSTYQGNTIGYRFVTEYHGDKANNIGKTEYEFTNWEDTGDNVSFPYHPPTDNEWLRGLAKYVTHHKKNSGNSYTKVKHTINNYWLGDYHLPLIFTPAPIRKNVNNGHSNPGTDLSSDGLLYDKDNAFFRLPLVLVYATNPFIKEYKVYHFTGGVLKPYTSKNIIYDNNGNATLETLTESNYDYNSHYQVASTITETSDGDAVIQTFTYPQDTSSPPPGVIKDLKDANRHVVLEAKSYKDTDNDEVADSNELTSTTETVYAWDGSVLEPSIVKTGQGTSSAVTRIEFKDYDSDGNILQVSKADGMDITYIYGYNNSLPVAKIENATYSQVLSQVANIQTKSNLDDDNCQDSSSCDEKNLRTALNALRNSLPNAMVTTYTYDPLVGVTSMTDPNGNIVYYEYDNFNRLLRAKDEDGKILSENKYHYKQ